MEENVVATNNNFQYNLPRYYSLLFRNNSFTVWLMSETIIPIHHNLVEFKVSKCLMLSAQESKPNIFHSINNVIKQGTAVNPDI